ncbi:MAG: globin-coupled sensor protein [Candidatus Obscuribacterales bacterium]|nr:globin-coupled sensor protein [Candidatus Obscuribacterales bacterium]
MTSAIREGHSQHHQQQRLTIRDLQLPNNDINKLKSFFGINKEDEKLMAGLQNFAAKSSAGLIEKFYKHILGEPETQKYFTDPRILERARQAQILLFEQMTSGKYDADYLENRLLVGSTHNRINLPPKWYIGSFAYYLDALGSEMADTFKEDKLALSNFKTFVKMVLLDMAMVMEAFVIERERQLMEGQRILQAQRTEVDQLARILQGVTAQISAVATELSSSTAQSTAAISETTATAEEVKQTADQTSVKAKSVSEDSKAVVLVSRQGQEATDATIKGMLRIREQMESIAECMVQLSNQSKLIGDIIASVDDLAQQSNLLAVNASIEAAKAGEQGKGFAVVAQEVKNLSQQSKSATAHVRSILNDIVKATTAATMATEQCGKAVEVGHKQASEAGKVIETLSESIDKASQATELIEVSSQQQLVGMKQMVEALESIRLSSQQNLESANQLDSAGKELAALGAKLIEMTSRN